MVLTPFKMTLLLPCLNHVVATLVVIVVNYNAKHHPTFCIRCWVLLEVLVFVGNIWSESDVLMFTVMPLHNSPLYSKLWMKWAVRMEEIETSQYLRHCENTVFCFQKLSKHKTQTHTYIVAIYSALPQPSTEWNTPQEGALTSAP